MKNLFNLDNPIMQMLARIGDLILLSIITLVLCLPIVTFGPAVTALFKTVYALTLDTCGAVIPTYFRAFRDNFKQSGIAGAAMLLVLASLVCDVLLLRTYYAGNLGNTYKALLAVVTILALLILSLTAYLFPLISRYNNTLSEHLRNAAILMIMNFPRTLLMVLVHLLPLLALYFQPDFVLRTLIFWPLLAPGLIAQADSWLLLPVFEKLEKELAEYHAKESEAPEEEDEL